MEKLKEYETLGCLHDLFKVQAEQTPDKIAIVFNDVKLTFRELDEKTDILSKNLIHHGSKPDAIVGIYMEKCIEYVIAYIAILKSGAAYMPLDVTYPKNLMCDIFEDASPVSILTNQNWCQRLEEMSGGEQNIISLTGEWDKELELQLSNLDRPSTNGQDANLDNLAYVCYSSGTTGKPKGIMCPHRGAVFSYTWRHLAYPFEEGDRVASNVFFVWEMFRPLLKGVPLYIIPDNVIYDPRLLAKFIKENSITRMLVTPSLLETVINTDGVDVDDFKSLRVIWFCGEVVTMSLLDRCMKTFPSTKFLNLYSVSECHDVAAANLSKYWEELKENDSSLPKFAPVGKVLPGVEIFILDENLVEQPPGVPGEIYVGGPTLARGYLKRPKLNAERFLEASKNHTNKRLYKTGDWGLVLANRVLEICGRCDTMVKIRGYSVETQAVEAALLQVSMVNACVVVTEGDEGTDKQLVAYVVPQQGATKKEIRSALKQKLPNYMIPSYFVFLKQIPMLASTGKLHKDKLPRIISGNKQNGDVKNEFIWDNEDESDLPKTETERTMTDIWSEILQFRVTDTEESFFDLGGHSLLAARLLGKIRDFYDVDIDVQTLFTHPTVTDLSKLIDSKNTDDGVRLPDSKHVDLENEVALNRIPHVNLDIQLRAFWRSANYGHRWRFGRVLLTGATGFLGTYILRDLLIHTKTNIYCLVRKHPELDIKERLRSTLEFYELFSNGDSEKLKKDFENRVHVISGDIALLNFGLSEEDYAYLSFEIDFVIHAAAYVNLLYPYEALKGANVHGTRNVLLFSTIGKIKALHYISTNSVFPNHKKNCKEAPSSGVGTELEDGYSESKWVAEQLVMNAIESGLPASIYRLGNLSGDREKSGWNPADFNLLVLRASMAVGMWPDVEWIIEMTPVDFVSQSVVRLSQNFAFSKHKVFHLINPNTLKSDEFLAMLQNLGYGLKMVAFRDWCNAVSQMNETYTPTGHPSPKKMLEVITKECNPALFSYDTTFDQAVFNDAMQTQLNVEYPTINKCLLTNYLRQLSRRKIIAQPKMDQTEKLQGKVALVTGASSGIGKAVALNLAKAGAKVCIAARRKEILEKIKQEYSDLAIETFCLDVTNRQQFLDVVKNIEANIGPIDILVNNAGLMYYTHMRNIMMDDWDRMIEVNCRGVTNGIGAVLPGMLQRCSGHIVNTSSDAGRRGFAGLAVYSGTKFFVEGVSQGLRHEVKGKGIRVTCIQPGDVKTELLSHTNDHDAKAEYDGSESCVILDPNDVGNAVVYAVTQPDHVGVNEILIEPRENPI